MQTDTEMLIRKLDSTFELTDNDRHVLSEMPIRVRELEADTDVVSEGMPRATAAS
jgi:hypothetical protein